MRPDTDALIVIDIQNDFCPGGALAVADGDAIIPRVNALMDEFPTVVLTQDWHPHHHASFAANHPGAAPFSLTDMPYGPQVLWPVHCVQATEGGHIDFAPLDSIEDAILARLRRRHNRVSVERVVAGPGIVDIYQALAALEQRTEPERDAIEIWSLGTSGEDSLAAAAVDRFCLSLGSVAGDLALAQGGFAGVVIAGGLGYRIRETLLTSGFGSRFKAKGRFESLMANIPVKLIVHPQPGLFGAAAAFAAEHGDAA